jgi:SAM-dependent methyltransferase
MPLSNAMLRKEDLDRVEPHYPLEVYHCRKCHLVQIMEFEQAQNIFSATYPYYSSYSVTWLDHCRRYTDMMVRRFDIGRGSFVVEIASNDGYLLQYFKDKGIQVLGIEPASGTAREAIRKGIPTDITFFNTNYARNMKLEGHRADLLVGNNVLAHNPELNDFVEGLRIALRECGVITMESPHLLRLMEQNQFDTIYHEHFSYFSLHSIRSLFRSHRLDIFDVEELPTHGGSLRIFARHAADSSRKVSPNVARVLAKEKAHGLTEERTYQTFAENVKLTKRRLLSLLIREKDRGKRIVGYGAPAKGNTLLNFCGVRTDFLDYTVDKNPHKQGMYLPGSQIPVFAPEHIMQDKPDLVLILPWNLKEEIMREMAEIRDWGGRFIIPIPKPTVV